MRRVLITGSRSWDDHAAVQNALNSELSQFPTGIIVVHGGAKGADSIAHSWAFSMLQAGYPVLIEKHRPEYDKHPFKLAPVRRNELMVSLGADVVHAFPLEGGTGTRNCMSFAYGAGIRVVNHGWQPYTYEAQAYAEAYLQTAPKTQKAFL